MFYLHITFKYIWMLYIYLLDLLFLFQIIRNLKPIVFLDFYFKKKACMKTNFQILIFVILRTGQITTVDQSSSDE